MNRIKVLYIDDEAAVRASLCEYLRDYDYEVHEAGDGRLGWKKIEETSPDIVLCDLRMPVMGGMEVLSRVRERYPQIPFIMISGASVMTDVVQALRLGAWDYIIKPIRDLDIVRHTIDHCLERAQLIQETQHYRRNLESLNQQLQHSLSVLEENQRAGRSIQQRLLPPATLESNGLVLNQRIVPSLYLSGDFIDYFTINANYTCFYLADVSGHGASSAFITILLKN